MIDILQQVDTSKLHMPKKGELSVCYGDFFNQSFENFSKIKLREARIAIELETTRIKALTEANYSEESIQILEEELEEAICCDEFYIDVDFGTAGTVAILNAVGCPTYTSCNGNQILHGGKGEDYPLIIFFAPHAMLDTLINVAKTTNCGLMNDDQGALQLYTDKVQNFSAFANELIARINKK